MFLSLLPSRPFPSLGSLQLGLIIPFIRLHLQLTTLCVLPRVSTQFPRIEAAMKRSCAIVAFGTLPRLYRVMV